MSFEDILDVLMLQQFWIKGLSKVIRRPSFWFIVALLVFVTFFHYREVVTIPTFLADFIDDFGLSRHAFERIFYLAIIIWSGFLFGWRGTDHGIQLAEGGNSGFEALLAGYKDGTVFWSGRYFDLGYFAAFWTRSQFDSLRAVGYFIYNNEGAVLRDRYDKTAAFSIRCVKD